MRIATWNINSIRARQDQVCKWLASTQPDILLLQEIKTEERDFPFLEFEAMGYTVLVKGQKSYNGVALLTKSPLLSPYRALPTFQDDPQARYVGATIDGRIVASVYAPNGNPVGTEKYTYKIEWMKRLKNHITTLLQQNIPFIIGGDFNVLAEDKDAFNFSLFANDALGRSETRQAWRALLHTGCCAAFRLCHPDEEKAYSFWDYQAGSWPRNMGLRLDDFLISPDLVDHLKDCRIDTTPRGWEKASDHTPVLIEFG